MYSVYSDCLIVHFERNVDNVEIYWILHWILPEEDNV